MHRKESMVEIVKFVYVMIIFIYLFFGAMNVDVAGMSFCILHKFF